ncbi:putative Chase2 sensor protein [Gloeothece citriformis PCC 7424]|uniref:Putative Chase2 sensor protein n=1 Tax=Gloeothece citriformis (strain PCC 7424) TaxID=65393 RepID=B7KBA5_GLOC7|nr:CHASE2 domain-containing protein [Gloeothece citriformis]ACK71461.1 putative Chase2 sensor protein [Gloeothece citriformis PCC 7424]
MRANFNSFYPYQPGGSLPPDSPTYVVRSCDQELFNALLAREYCYVLNARQMGKSSLRIQVMGKLKAKGIACAEIELSGIGSQQINANQWYGGIIQELISGFDLVFERRNWLREREDLSPVQRLSNFIETVLLKQISQPIVIFIDEIDSVLSLKFPTDEFFALIRHCYDKRANHPEYKRLSFVLLGVATPSDLITDPNATPFNIGRAIELKGFNLSEIEPLAQGFIGKADNPKAVLTEILYWSGGQPFLTQKLCWLALNFNGFIPRGKEKTSIKALVTQQIIEDWESHDEPEHLRTIRDRLLRNSRSTFNLLKLYQKLLRWGKIPVKDTPSQMELRLSGLVSQQKGKLAIKNPIYQKVFNRHWVSQQIKSLETRKTTLSLGYVGFSSAIVALTIIGVRPLGIFQQLELKTLDNLMVHLPHEKPDQRLLVVGADEKDLSLYGHPIPDNILAQVLTKLEQYHPHVMGLDLVRDQPVPPGTPKLNEHFKHNSNLIGGCAFGGDNPAQSIHSPPQIPSERIGFFDVYSEDSQKNNQDYTVRRYLLSRTSNPNFKSSICQTPYSFGWQLVYRYLNAQGIPVTTEGDNWKFGDLVVLRLKSGSGGYQKLDDRGNQLLLRYRNTPDPEAIAPRLSFRDILNNTSQFDPNLVKNRVILIGVIAASVPDPHDTPYGRIRGLYIHAHLVSQLISAVEDENRPLIWWFPRWGEVLWVIGWSLTGGLLVWWLKKPFYQGVGMSVCVVLLYGCCWYGLCQGGWFPLIPGVFALLGTGVSLISVQIVLELRQKENL